MTSNPRPNMCFVSLAAYGYFRPDRTDVTGGGAERQIYLLSRELSKQYDVHVVVGDYGQPAREVVEGVTLHRAYAPGPNSSIPRLLANFASLAGAMHRADADVYVYRGHPRKAAFTYAVARLLRSKWVYNLANDPNVTTQRDELPVPIRSLFDRAIRDSDAVISQNERQRETVSNRYGITPTTVPNGYPAAEEILPHDDREFFLWVGRLNADQKRPDKYLDLAARVPDQRFLLIGPASSDSAYQEQLERRATELPNVEYVGPVDPDAIHDYYRQSKALINTSAYEGFPNTFLEAWRYATPVVSLSVDPGRFLDGNSIDYADGDFDRFVASVQALSEDLDARRNAGETAKETFAERYALSTVANQYADTLPLEVVD